MNTFGGRVDDVAMSDPPLSFKLVNVLKMGERVDFLQLTQDLYLTSKVKL